MSHPLPPEDTQVITNQPGQVIPPGTNLNVNVTPPSDQYFTADQVAAFRQQEKDKLYPQLEQLKVQNADFQAQLESLNADKQSREAAAKATADAEAVTARAAAEQKMSVAELMAAREKELADRQAAFEKSMLDKQQEMAAQQALLQRETEFQTVVNYTQRRLLEERAARTIMPELEEFITGDSPDKVEESITRMKEKTAKIISEATGNPPVPLNTGVLPTGLSPAGPLDALAGQTAEPTAEQIKAMDNDQYAAYRKRIGLDRASNNQGLMGTPTAYVTRSRL
jgi:hypothetical protein